MALTHNETKKDIDDKLWSHKTIRRMRIILKKRLDGHHAYTPSIGCFIYSDHFFNIFADY